MLRALRYRDYRLFFGGQIVSLTGTWITTTGGALWFAAGLSSWHEDIHPVYVELGIVPGAYKGSGSRR